MCRQTTEQKIDLFNEILSAPKKYLGRKLIVEGKLNVWTLCEIYTIAPEQKLIFVFNAGGRLEVDLNDFISLVSVSIHLGGD